MGEVDAESRGDHSSNWRAPYRRVLIAIPVGIAVLEAVTVAWGWAAGNRQLLKDGLDWSYDVALYGVAALTFGREARAERAVAGFVAAVMAAAGAHTLYDLWDKIVAPRPIEFVALGFAAVSAVAAALAILAGLWRFRRIDHPIVQATWLSSRNDAISTTLYSVLNLAARATPELRWPEYALDLLAAALAFQASFAILSTLLRERRREKP
ncbi:MAG: hypothetical protein HZY79_11535 [Rhodoblastus sp.]|nr:MAG: hypothetical protein HZY79_11535 [Rhodoblastus sp.]